MYFAFTLDRIGYKIDRKFVQKVISAKEATNLIKMVIPEI